MSTSALLAWVVLPYVSFALLISGLIWRYKKDQYGWTSRSSQWISDFALVFPTVSLRYLVCSCRPHCWFVNSQELD